MSLPLENIIVLDFSQYLSGPSAALRLADFGARVIKIERPGCGDNSRHLKLHNLDYMGDSVLFQTINRNKESFCANLKSEKDIDLIKKLIKKADVIIENFRPGIMKKLGLDYDSVNKINPHIIYGTVTGYGCIGPWVKKPGQDLLVQSISGLPWLNGNNGQPPMPFALSLADSYAGVHLAEGILACLYRRTQTKHGGLVEVSLLESILDMQFEVISTYLNDGEKPPKRSNYNNAHAYLSAPYGIYQTSDSFIALAMGSIIKLAEIFNSKKLAAYNNPSDWFDKRDEIKKTIGEILCKETTSYWLKLLEKHDYWCAPVYTWDELIRTDAFKALKLLIDIRRPGGNALYTIRCPITLNSSPAAVKHAPYLGENTAQIIKEFSLQPNEAIK